MITTHKARKFIGFGLSDEKIAEIDAIARAQGVSRSEFVRQAVLEKLHFDQLKLQAQKAI